MTGIITHVDAGYSTADEQATINILVSFDITARLYQWNEEAMQQAGIAGIAELHNATVTTDNNYNITNISPVTT